MLALAAVVAAAVLGLSACGDRPLASPGVASVSPTTTAQPGASGGKPSRSRGADVGAQTTAASAVAGGPTPTVPSPASLEEQMLRFAECMRSHGITNFPDPSGGGFSVPVSDHQSPQFQAAQAACQKYLPPGPGSGRPPSPQALAKMLRIANCMRRHGISEFPDPRTKAPPLGQPGTREVSDIDGVILVFPTTLDTQSPAFARAAAACNFPLHNH